MSPRTNLSIELREFTILSTHNLSLLKNDSNATNELVTDLILSTCFLVKQALIEISISITVSLFLWFLC